MKFLCIVDAIGRNVIKNERHTHSKIGVRMQLQEEEEM